MATPQPPPATATATLAAAGTSPDTDTDSLAASTAAGEAHRSLWAAGVAGAEEDHATRLLREKKERDAAAAAHFDAHDLDTLTGIDEQLRLFAEDGVGGGGDVGGGDDTQHSPLSGLAGTLATKEERYWTADQLRVSAAVNEAQYSRTLDAMLNRVFPLATEDPATHAVVADRLFGRYEADGATALMLRPLPDAPADGVVERLLDEDPVLKESGLRKARAAAEEAAAAAAAEAAATAAAAGGGDGTKRSGDEASLSDTLGKSSGGLARGGHASAISVGLTAEPAAVAAPNFRVRSPMFGRQAAAARQRASCVPSDQCSSVPPTPLHGPNGGSGSRSSDLGSQPGEPAADMAGDVMRNVQLSAVLSTQLARVLRMADEMEAAVQVKAGRQALLAQNAEAYRRLEASLVERARQAAGSRRAATRGAQQQLEDRTRSLENQLLDVRSDIARIRSEVADVDKALLMEESDAYMLAQELSRLNMADSGNLCMEPPSSCDLALAASPSVAAYGRARVDAKKLRVRRAAADARKVLQSMQRRPSDGFAAGRGALSSPGVRSGNGGGGGNGGGVKKTARFDLGEGDAAGDCEALPALHTPPYASTFQERVP